DMKRDGSRSRVRVTGSNSCLRGLAFVPGALSSTPMGCRSLSNATTVGRRAYGLASLIVASASSRSDYADRIRNVLEGDAPVNVYLDVSARYLLEEFVGQHVVGARRE